MSSQKPLKVFMIPDTQCRPGVPLDACEWSGLAIREYAPDVIVHIGDHWDLPSLSTWSMAGSMEREGRRLQDDIYAGIEGMDLIKKGAGAHYKKARKIFCVGNHEQRISRCVSADPKLQGFLSLDSLGIEKFGYEVVDYIGSTPGQIEVNGVIFTHYLANAMTSKPIGGTIQNRIKAAGQSFVAGHQQVLLQGSVEYATGRVAYGLVAGSNYIHDEEYRGLHNKGHHRGPVVLHEVFDGSFLSMPLSINYLCRKYTGMELKTFLKKRYPDFEGSLVR